MKEKVLPILKELVPYVLIILTVVLIRTYVITPVRVDGKSMESTFQDGDILLLKKYDHTFERFDVLVFKRRKNVQQDGKIKKIEERLVKRVIGFPGEHIAYKSGKLYVNQEEIEEPFIDQITKDFDLNDLGYETIPEDYYFVMGDNRNNSADSRLFGLVPKKDIVGTSDFVIFPFSKFGKIKSY